MLTLVETFLLFRYSLLFDGNLGNGELDVKRPYSEKASTTRVSLSRLRSHRSEIPSTAPMSRLLDTNHSNKIDPRPYYLWAMALSSDTVAASSGFRPVSATV